jgi:F-type H+-transporting ATPase subunit b
MMKKNQKTILFQIFTFCVFTFAFTAVVLASGGEEGGGSLWKEYMWKIINFLILVVILVKFGKKPIQNFLKQRTEMIAKTLQEAKEAKEAAQKALQEVEGRLKAKDTEIEAIIAAAKRSGEQERDKLIEDSARLKEQIVEQAKTNIDFEVKHAKEVIKAEAVEIAMELAEKKIKEKITKDDQERLLQDSLVKIGGKG